MAGVLTHIVPVVSGRDKESGGVERVRARARPTGFAARGAPRSTDDVPTAAGNPYTHGRTAAHGVVHPTRKASTSWYLIPPAVPLSPAVPYCTTVSGGMNPPMGRDSSVNTVPFEIAGAGIVSSRHRFRA